MNMSTMFRIFLTRLRALFRLQKADRDFDDEMQSHLQLLTERFVHQGMSPQDAVWAARRQFGNQTLVQQRQRELRTFLSPELFWRDLRFGVRQLRRNPLFTAIAVVSLALGIGANTAVFTLLDQLVLRLLPVKDPQQLVMIWSTGPHMGSNEGPQRASYPMYQDFQQEAKAFDYVFCRYDMPVAISSGDNTDQVNAELVSGNYFQALHVGPAIGRVFAPDTDDRIYEGHPFVILSHLYWINHFGGDPGVLGKKILVNSRWMEIVGVSAPGFSGLDPSSSPDLWIPIQMKPLMTPGSDDMGNRRSQWIQIFARMKRGYTVASARASLQPLFHQILLQEIEEPALNHLSQHDRNLFLRRTVMVETAATGYSDLRREYSTALVVLMGMAGLILLIVCSNIANLLLARASARRQEIGVRLAIGARRKTLVAQLLLESMLLSFAGTALGILLSAVATRGLLNMLPRHGNELMLHARPDARVLLFSIMAALFAGLLFGLAPALQGTRLDLWTSLKSGSTATTEGNSSTKMRKSLVAIQVALSFLLLAGAGLFTRTLMNLKNTRTGFQDIDKLVTFQMDPAKYGYSLPRIRALYTDLLSEFQATPDVRSAAYAMWPLLNGHQWDITVAVEGHPRQDGENMQALYNVVSPGFWKTVGLPLLRGRDFTDRDRFDGNDAKQVPTVAIVNRAFAEHFFGKENPVGRHIGCCRGTATVPDIEIVGMVENSLFADPRASAERQIFFPYLQSTAPRSVTFYAHTAAAPETVFAQLKSLVAKRDGTIPLYAMKTLQGQMNETLSTERLIASLSFVFGGLATTLAALGLYGVMSFLVARRTKEIGLRMALGASRRSVAWLILREAIMLLGAGLMIGLPCAYFSGRYLSAQLFGVHPADMWTYTAAIAILGSMTLIAGLISARKATAIDPLTALRYE